MLEESLHASDDAVAEPSKCWEAANIFPGHASHEH